MNEPTFITVLSDEEMRQEIKESLEAHYRHKANLHQFLEWLYVQPDLKARYEASKHPNNQDQKP